MDINIEENRNNIKSKENFQKDYYLNKLIELNIEYNTIPGFNNFVNVLFYAKKKKDYDNQFIMFNMTYPNSIEEITKVYKLFNTWLPFKKYDLGELRGTFLEFLTYAMLKEEYPQNQFYRESKIRLDNYISHTWDIIRYGNLLHLYECKFSQHSLKRNHINQMIGLINKLDQSKTFATIVFFSPYEKVKRRLEHLQLDTKTEKYEAIINKFSIMTINDFKKKNPFRKE